MLGLVKARFWLAAEFELDEAIVFYEKCGPGLGQEFLVRRETGKE